MPRYTIPTANAPSMNHSGDLFGQFDLTASLGIPGQFDHSLFADGTQKVLEACYKPNKAATLAVTDPEQLADRPANGFRLLVCAFNVWIYQ